MAGHIVAAGGPGELCFWDRRAPKAPLATLDDVHMDAVACVRFHPDNPNICVSASDDGLIAVFDFAAGVNDDEAFAVRSGPLPISLRGMVAMRR